MTTNELIEVLKRVDPTGDATVCCGNRAICLVDSLPAYYDGPLQVIHRSISGCPQFAEITGSGNKVVMVADDIEDALMDYPELPVKIDHVGSYTDTVYEEMVAKWRAEGRQWRLDYENGKGPE